MRTHTIPILIIVLSVIVPLVYSRFSTTSVMQMSLLSPAFTPLKTFTTDMVTINTGPIPGLPTCTQPKFAIGSIMSASSATDSITFLLGDSQGVTATKATIWFSSSASVSTIFNFGSKLVAYSNPGVTGGETFSTVYGVWQFIMIPLKDDGSFDITPYGMTGTNTAKMLFDIVAYL